MLNERQQAAVDSDAKQKSIVAGAGTGKTHTLTEMIRADLRAGNDPSCTYAITFTRNAAMELLERLESKIGVEAQDIFANTIHGFCLEVINTFLHKTGYKDNFNIYDQEDRKDIIKSVIRYMKVKKVKYEDVEAYVYTGATKTLFEPMVYEEYLDRMRLYNAIDLNMIIPMAMALLQDQEVNDYYKEHAKHFYVDEFQDTNDMQLALLKLLKMESLVIIGDPDQAIYEWNGARPENMVNISDVFPDMEQFVLEDNYRSTRQIIEKANRLIRYNKNRIDKKLVGQKDGGAPNYYELANDNLQALKILEGIKEPLASNAVICRTNKQAQFINEYLEEKGITCNLISSSGDPFKKPAAKDLIKLLVLANNIQDDYAAYKVARWMIGLSDKNIQKIIASKGGKTLFEALRDETTVGEALYHRLKSIDELGLKDRSYAYDYIMEVIDKCDVLGYYKMTDRNNKLKQIDEFRREVRVWQIRQKYFGRNRGFVEFMKYIKLRDIQEKYSKARDAVNIMTVHGAKGLEFERVFVPYMNEKSFPMLRGGNPNVPEERRIMYVAVTRAREELILLRPETSESYSKAMLAQKESRFMSEMMW